MNAQIFNYTAFGDKILCVKNSFYYFHVGTIKPTNTSNIMLLDDITDDVCVQSNVNIISLGTIGINAYDDRFDKLYTVRTNGLIHSIDCDKRGNIYSIDNYRLMKYNEKGILIKTALHYISSTGFLFNIRIDGQYILIYYINSDCVFMFDHNLCFFNVISMKPSFTLYDIFMHDNKMYRAFRCQHVEEYNLQKNVLIECYETNDDYKIWFKYNNQIKYYLVDGQNISIKNFNY